MQTVILDFEIEVHPEQWCSVIDGLRAAESFALGYAYGFRWHGMRRAAAPRLLPLPVLRLPPDPTRRPRRSVRSGYTPPPQLVRVDHALHSVTCRVEWQLTDDSL